MRKIIFALLFLFPLPSYAYISPGRPQGFVSDFAGVINVEEKTEIEQILHDYDLKTGNQIAVVFINDLGGETIETYATSLFEEWEIGKKGKDNGVLFLASLSEKEMRIEVGYGLEGDLTDIESKKIVSDVVPAYFALGEYGQGARAVSKAIIGAISGEYVFDSGSAVAEHEGSFDFGYYFWLIIFVFMWLGSVLSRSRSWWLGGIIGAVCGIIIWIIRGFWIYLPIFVVGGLIFDYLVSTKYKQVFERGTNRGIFPWLFFIGGRPGSRWDRGPRGGFGGFGGGMSGGGGASGRW